MLALTVKIHIDAITIAFFGTVFFVSGCLLIVARFKYKQATAEVKRLKEHEINPQASKGCTGLDSGEAFGFYRDEMHRWEQPKRTTQ